MVELVKKIGKKGEIVIPAEIRKKYDFMPGKYVKITCQDDVIEIKIIDPEQAYFWTKEWQQAEKEASEDIKQGRMSPIFSSAKEGINYLKTITEKSTKAD
ncbi:MAG: AbrB/MazE/SpoVT family DNA-binding domain-containing protein [Thermodesulfobacteriota bacterium]|nr:MAG: AbrB/MazE/SpoVT family DNA-binding domain-containing protein [Thermodesulfobacteriota bacterium]